MEICETVKQVVPDMHIRVFWPLEIWQGAQTLDALFNESLTRLEHSSLSTRPGTAAEILIDEIRSIIRADAKKNLGKNQAVSRWNCTAWAAMRTRAQRPSVK